MHRVVAGALTGPGGVLVAHRRSDRAYYPDCWDLPGGHVELGESAHDALVREPREEIGVRAFMSGPPIATITSEGDDPMHLDLWVISRWVGAPRNLAPEEHDELRWATADQLAALDLAHPRYCALLTSLIKNDRAV